MDDDDPLMLATFTSYDQFQVPNLDSMNLEAGVNFSNQPRFGKEPMIPRRAHWPDFYAAPVQRKLTKDQLHANMFIGHMGYHLYLYRQTDTLWVMWSLLSRLLSLSQDNFPFTYFRLNQPRSPSHINIFFSNSVLLPIAPTTRWWHTCMVDKRASR